MKLRSFAPEFLANFHKGLVELLGLDGTDNLPLIFKLPMTVAMPEDTAEQLCQRYGIPADDEHTKHVAAAIER
jgi:hypothetical protein